LEKAVLKTPTGTPYLRYFPDEVIEIESTPIKNPTLVQVGVPHDVRDVTEDRLCVSVCFLNKETGKRPTMSESQKLFDQFICINE
jgi:hypothetical protein